jgi:hypothetical protein
MNELDETYQNLFDLAVAFAEVAPHHELYKNSPLVPHSFDASRFIADHGRLPSSTPHFVGGVAK